VRRKLTFYALIALGIMILIPMVGYGQGNSNQPGPPDFVREKNEQVGPPAHVLEKFQVDENANSRVVEQIETAYEELLINGSEKPLEAKLRQVWREQVHSSYTNEEHEYLRRVTIELENKGFSIMPVTNVFAYGKPMKFDVPPVIKEGRTLVPVRSLSSAYGFVVDYNADEKKISLEREDLFIEFILDDYKAIVNGETILLDAPPTALNGRTVLPLRFFIDQLGIDIKYNQNDRSIEIGIDIDEMEEIYDNLIDDIVKLISQRDDAGHLDDEKLAEIDTLITRLINLADDIDLAIEKELNIKLGDIEKSINEIKAEIMSLLDHEDNIANLEMLRDDVYTGIVKAIENRDNLNEMLTEDQLDKVNEIIEDMLSIYRTIGNAIGQESELDANNYKTLFEDLEKEINSIFDEAQDLDTLVLMELFLDNLNEQIEETLEERSLLEEHFTNNERTDLDSFVTELVSYTELLQSAIDDEEILDLDEIKHDVDVIFDKIESIFELAREESALLAMVQYYTKLVHDINDINEAKEMFEDSLSQIDLFHAEYLILELIDTANELYIHIEEETIVDLDEFTSQVDQSIREINNIFTTEI